MFARPPNISLQIKRFELFTLRHRYRFFDIVNWFRMDIRMSRANRISDLNDFHVVIYTETFHNLEIVFRSKEPRDKINSETIPSAR